MVDAFATVADVSARLNRDFTGSEIALVETLLADASAYLRSQIGQVVYPRQQVTATLWPTAGRVDFPQQPVVSIDEVKRNGAAINYTARPGFIIVDGDEPVVVKFTFGYLNAPDELVRWTCVLVSQTLTMIEANLGLSVAGLSSVSIDDFRIAFADGGDRTGMELSDRAIRSLREQFGTGSVTVVGSV